jgi:hypothetical protein
MSHSEQLIFQNKANFGRGVWKFIYSVSQDEELDPPYAPTFLPLLFNLIKIESQGQALT